MRKPDMLGRWGGEEFILLLPHTDRVSARLVADRMRAAMEAHDFPEIGRVTASFGVATGRAKDTTEKLVERADTALYAAKQNGRNRVETDSEEIDRESEYDRVGFDFVRLVWRPAYECGHELIDLQHRMLFDDANQLLDAIIGNHPKEEVSRLIDRLLKDAVQHFDDEEAILKAAGYAEIETHARQHAELVTKALDLSVRNAADKLTLGELFSFLATELVARHLLSEDRKFFSCLEESAS
jgi:hemerythrin-like metal-binding protein